MNRPGKFDKTRVKLRTLLITVRNEYDKKQTMADNCQKNQVLKERRELLEEGVPREKLKNRNFELFNDGKKIEIDSTSPSPRNKVHHD